MRFDARRDGVGASGAADGVIREIRSGMVCDKSWPDVAAGVGIIALRGFLFSQLPFRSGFYGGSIPPVHPILLEAPRHYD